MMEKSKMRLKIKVSVIIPAYNEEKCIKKCLESLTIQTYKNFEAIVIDDGSSDNTLKIVKDFSKEASFPVRILKQQHKGPGAARNFGARKARGQVLVLLDADIVCDKNFIENLVKPIFANETVGTVHDLEKVANPHNIWARCGASFHPKFGLIRKYNKEREEQFFRAIRRGKFLKVGGFDPSLGYADDSTLAPKIGNAKVINAMCFHNNPSSLREVFKQEKWIGNSYSFRYGINKIKFISIPLVLLIFFALLLKLSISFTILIAILLYIVTLLFISIKRSIEEKFPKYVLFLPIFLTIKIIGRGAGMLKQIFKKGEPK